MKNINSISGGKTSSYLATHYPADKKLVQIISDKIGHEFVATAESDLTLKVVLDLEQLLGTEIKWLTGETFEQVIKSKGSGIYLPNIMTRYCTSEMKIKVIADYCRNVIGEIVNTRLGIRYDEDHRVNYDNTDYKFHIANNSFGQKRRVFKTEKYRELEYPLVDDKIMHHRIYLWSLSTNINFPPDSNCVGCFHKDPQQLRKNWDDEPLKMQWFADQEKGKARFKKEMRYDTIKKIGLQTDFSFGTGSGCNSGGCTD